MTTQVDTAPTGSGYTVQSGDVLVVRNGGLSVSSLVSGGGGVYVWSGGTANFTQVDGGGQDVVLSGGMVSGTLLESGAVELVSSGGEASGTVIDSGGTQVLLPGAHAGGTVFSGGQVISADVAVISTVYESFGGISSFSLVTAGSGRVSGLTVRAGEALSVWSGGIAVGATVTGSIATAINIGAVPAESEGEEVVYSGGVASGTTVLIGIDTVSGGGTAIDTVVVSGTEIVASGGIASHTILSGTQDVASGGDADGTMVDGGFAFVSSGGTVNASVVTNFGVLDVSGGAVGITAAAGGTINVFAFGVATDDVISGGGTEVVAGGTASATTVLSGGSQMIVAGGLATGGVVSSGGSEIVSGGTASGTSVGIGGAIALPTIPFAGGSASVDPATDVLTFGNGVASYTQQLAGSYAGVHFNVGPVSEFSFADGTLLSLAPGPACFARGTLIRTDRGDAPVEQLAAGDRLLLHDGRIAPIVWVGRRSIDCARHPDPALVWPVRVTAGAFGPGMPRRDLLLSPDHAVFVADVLVPIRHLIDGDAVVQVPVAEVTYCHVELPVHDILLAEGMPAESYLDTGGRGQFANGGEPARSPPAGASPKLARYIREARGHGALLATGPRLEAIRRALRRRARSARPKRTAAGADGRRSG